ncbi:MAG: hypothetical protein RJB39_721 [Candidatus Parcubacteria bacterium]|jgi:hypothetical protein
MNPELIQLLEEASCRLAETEELLTRAQKDIDSITVPTEQISTLVRRHRAAQERFQSQRSGIFMSLVNITLLFPDTHFSGLVSGGATSESVCVEPTPEPRIKVWRPVHEKVRFMTPTEFVRGYPIFNFSRSLIYQIRDAVAGLKKVGDTETLQQVAALYRETFAELAPS